MAALTMVGCQQKDPVEDDPVEEDQLGDVYLIQASTNPNTFEVTDETTGPVQLPVSLFLSGFKSAKDEISAELEIQADLVSKFNTDFTKECVEVPADAYSIDKTTVSIKSGSNSSDVAYVTIDVAKLAKGTDYVLPVQIKSCTYDKVLAEKSVAYYEINVAPEPEPEPELTGDLVLALGGQAHGRFFQGAGTDIVFINDDQNSDVMVYSRGVDGKYAYDCTPGQGWHNAGVPFDPVFVIKPYTFVFRLGSSLQEFSFFDRYVNWMGAFIYQYDEYMPWADVQKIFRFKDAAVLTVYEDMLCHHDVYNVDSYDANHWILLREKVDIASGDWASYPVLFCCGNYIVAVDAEGQMYAWPLSDTFELGEKQILDGGWNKFEHIFAMEEKDLYCVDSKGDVYVIPFTPAK